MNEKVRNAVNEKATPSEIKKIARSDGMVTLRECTIKKLLQGVATFDEVLRVTGE